MLSSAVNIAVRDVLPTGAGRFRGPAFRRGVNRRLPLRDLFSLIASQQQRILSTTAGSTGITMHTGALRLAATRRLLTPEVKRWLLPRSPSPRPRPAHPIPR